MSEWTEACDKNEAGPRACVPISYMEIGETLHMTRCGSGVAPTPLVCPVAHLSVFQLFLSPHHLS